MRALGKLLADLPDGLSLDLGTANRLQIEPAIDADRVQAGQFGMVVEGQIEHVGTGDYVSCGDGGVAAWDAPKTRQVLVDLFRAGPAAGRQDGAEHRAAQGRAKLTHRASPLPG